MALGLVFLALCLSAGCGGPSEEDRAAQWRIIEASWEAVPVDGLFPESLAILRELFPDL